jgi:hypothetical protein
MLGGALITATTLAHAQEMLTAAAKELKVPKAAS